MRKSRRKQRNGGELWMDGHKTDSEVDILQDKKVLYTRRVSAKSSRK